MEERHIQVILAVRYDRWCVKERAALSRGCHGKATAWRTAQREKSPSLLIEKNPGLMRFGARHSVRARHFNLFASYVAVLACSVEPDHDLRLPGMVKVMFFDVV